VIAALVGHVISLTSAAVRPMLDIAMRFNRTQCDQSTSRGACDQ
jgi:hypothetical protein